ncbi:unnamed protein product [Brassicogethes aeneus]|uniref:Uncharacterized protein n=1 Tax=Brassicogethes aeneus TaxID=1431903 RepID=A0A9P0B9Z9_BRAAE|nr:unnamed protein product [Brassicogethes aeneus]
MPQSREEKLRKKREAEKKRYERLKQDPEGREKLRQKERDQYSKKKENNIVQPISKLSKRDQRMKRKQWRKNSTTYRLRKKQTENENHFLEENTPPPSPVRLENVNDVPRDTPQSISGRRLAAKNRKIRSRRSKEKNELIEKLKKKITKYKVKYHRLRNLTKEKRTKREVQLSPKTRVNEMMRENQNPDIIKKLLFAEVVKDQLKTNYKELKSDNEKQIFRQVLSGKIIKKYQITNDLREISLNRLKVINEHDPNSVMSSFCCENTTEKCLLRECFCCKYKKVLYKDQDSSIKGHYFKWCSQKETYFDKKTKKEKSVSKITKRKFECPLAEIIEEFESNIIKYLKHRGRARHQYKRITKMKEELKSNEALIHMDFSENYNLKYAEEVQSFHFGGSRQQISLHTVVMYTKSGEELKKECFCTLSESLQHNVPGIWAHLDPILKYIEENYLVDTLYFVSDSPATQYRNKTMFYFLAVELPSLYTKIKNFSWNYLEAGHGKGAPDGIGGVTKRTADRLVAQGNDIASFDTLVNALSKNVKGIKYLTIDSSDIAKLSERLENKECPNFKGTMKVHQVKKDLSQKSAVQLNFYSLSSLGENDSALYLGPLIYKSTSISPLGEASNTSSFDEDMLTYITKIYDEEAGPSVKNKGELSCQNIRTGTYLLVQLKTKKICYRYVAVAQNDIEEDGEVRVMYLRVCKLNKKQVFKIDENDMSYVRYEDITSILPSPIIISHKCIQYYQFEKDIDVFEQGTGKLSKNV